MRTRKKVPERIDKLADVAIGIFGESGYHDAGMDEVATKLGVTVGALYRYIEGKEALVELAFRRAMQPEAPLPVQTLPVPARPLEESLQILAGFLAQNDLLKTVMTHLQPDAKQPWDRDSMATEFGEVAGAVYDLLHGWRRGIRMIEKLAEEWPALHELWYSGARDGFTQVLATWLELRARRGFLRPLGDKMLAAKYMEETLAFFAIDRCFESVPYGQDEATIRAQILDRTVAAFVAD